MTIEIELEKITAILEEFGHSMEGILDENIDISDEDWYRELETGYKHLYHALNKITSAKILLDNRKTYPEPEPGDK